MFDFSVVIERFEETFAGFIIALPGFFAGIIVLLVFSWLSRRVKPLVERTFRRGRPVQSTLPVVLGRLVQWAVLLTGVLLGLTIALPSLEPSQFVEALGISSVAVGFAFRDILQNFLAGILLLFNQPFWIGDQIRFGPYEGTVEDIRTRATLLKTYDGRRVIIPNAQIFTQPVTVNTAFPRLRTEYRLGIGYGDDVERARELVLETLREIEEVLIHPAPTTWVVELADSSVQLGVWWWTESRRADVVVVQGKVLAAIKQKLSAHGIDLPYPTQQVLFHDQTEVTDGDRARQREGWPAGPDGAPGPRGIAAALDRMAGNGHARVD